MNGKALLHVALAVALLVSLGTPQACAAFPVAKVAHSCCGKNCHCPQAASCKVAIVPAHDLQLPSQEQVTPAPGAPVALFALAEISPVISSVKTTVRKPESSPLLCGSPPQAILRLWLL